MTKSSNISRRAAIQGTIAAGVSFPILNDAAKASTPSPIYERIAAYERAAEAFSDLVGPMEDGEDAWLARKKELGVVQTPATVTGFDSAEDALAAWDAGEREPFRQLRDTYLDVVSMYDDEIEAEIDRVHFQLSQSVPYLACGNLLQQSASVAKQVAQLISDRVSTDPAFQKKQRIEADYEAACDADSEAFLELLACPVSTPEEGVAKVAAINASDWGKLMWEENQIEALLSSIVPDN